MTILVTGATGYIGREFVKAYSKDFKFIVLARESSDINQLELLNCTIEKYTDFEKIDEIFLQNNIDGVIHFASNVVVEHTVNQIDSLIDSNIKFGVYLLEACKKNNSKWFINTGTFWQNYESDHYNPVNLYASTKEAFQDIAKYYTQTSSLIFTTIKLNDTFGANDPRPKIFNLWDKYSKSGEVLDMSEGEQIIDTSYIEDVISAFKTMIENLQKDNNVIYNNNSYIVTSNQKMSLKELARLFEKITKRKLNINWGGRSYREREVMKPYDKGILVPNWIQKYTLEEAIKKTIGEN